MRRLLLIVLLTLSATGLRAAPFADASADGSSVSLAEQALFLIQQGDDTVWASPSFDDGRWRRTSLPSSWEKIFPGWSGICWYRLHLRFPSELPIHAYGLQLGVINAADEVFFNGVRIGASGSVVPPSYAFDKKRLYEIPPMLIRPGEDNVVAVRVLGTERPSNGPYKGHFLLGTFSSLDRAIAAEDMIDFFFVLIFVLFSGYFLMSYFFRGREGYLLYFSLFCITMGAYLLLRTQLKYRLGIDFLAAKRIEYLLLPVHPLLLLEFVRSYFARSRNALFRVYYVCAAAVIAGFAFAGSVDQLIFINNWINEVSWLIPAVLVGWILVGEIRGGNRTAYLVGAVIVVFILCAAADVITNRMVLDFPRLDMYGVMLLIVSLAAAIETRSISMRAELIDIRQHLENKVASRTNELNSANERLQAFNRHISELNDQYHQDFWLAVKVQKAITPHPFGNEYWRIAVRFQPTGAISGDFYDIYKIRGGSLGVIVADAAGHGVAAALITMIAKPIFMHAMKRYGASSMKAMMETANSEFLEEIGEINEFLSAEGVRLDADSVTFVNAGHPPGVLCSGGNVRYFYSTGSYLGMPELVMPYQQETAPVREGDVLLMFSDALIEAKNEQGEDFGLARVTSILGAGCDSPDDLVAMLADAVYRFTGSRRLKDDLTIVACQRRQVSPDGTS